MSNLPGDMWSLKLVQGAFSNHRIWPALPHAVAIYALSMATCRMTETNFFLSAAGVLLIFFSVMWTVSEIPRRDQR